MNEGPIRTDSLLLAICKEVKLNLISAHISQNVAPLPRHCSFLRNLLDSIDLEQNNRPLESVLSSAAGRDTSHGRREGPKPEVGLGDGVGQRGQVHVHQLALVGLGQVSVNAHELLLGAKACLGGKVSQGLCRQVGGPDAKAGA